MESNAVVVHVRATPEDAIAFQRNVCNKVAALRPYRLLTVLALAFLLSSMAFGPIWFEDLANLEESVAFVSSLLVGIIPIALIQYFAAQKRQSAMYDPKGSFMRPCEIVASPNGVAFKNDVVDVKCNWAAFLHVEETPTHFFLYTDNVIAHIVPKREFATAEDASRFGEILRANIKPAQRSA